ncbi:hypothetical protein RB598_001784 [Gaeumannomyces tritici]
MFASTLASTLLLCAAGALAQTPAGTAPSTDKNLPVTFGGNVPLTPGEELPYALVQARPQLKNTAGGSSTGPFIIAMLDQDLPAAIFPSNSTSTLVPGDGPGRTTRLHWFQTNVTISTGPDGQLNLEGSPSSVYAPYEGPQPPKGDIPHKYVLYQFFQPIGFVVPQGLADGNFLDTSSNARNNFSIGSVTSQPGVLLMGANWMRVQNPNNTCAATVPTNSSSSACPSGSGGAAATATISLTRPGGAGATTTPVRVSRGARVVVGVPALVLGVVAVFLL